MDATNTTQDQPGTAIVARGWNDERFVFHADRLILVAPELLQPGATEPGVWQPDDRGGILTLDSAGDYRYRWLRTTTDAFGIECHLFERIEER